MACPMAFPTVHGSQAEQPNIKSTGTRRHWHQITKIGPSRSQQTNREGAIDLDRSAHSSHTEIASSLHTLVWGLNAATTRCTPAHQTFRRHGFSNSLLQRSRVKHDGRQPEALIHNPLHHPYIQSLTPASTANPPHRCPQRHASLGADGFQLPARNGMTQGPMANPITLDRMGHLPWLAWYQASGSSLARCFGYYCHVGGCLRWEPSVHLSLRKRWMSHARMLSEHHASLACKWLEMVRPCHAVCRGRLPLGHISRQLICRSGHGP